MLSICGNAFNTVGKEPGDDLLKLLERESKQEIEREREANISLSIQHFETLLLTFVYFIVLIS